MNIRFTERGFARYRECALKTINLEHSLDRAIAALAKWEPWDSTVVIGEDFDELSFFFAEEDRNGKRGMCGGIIFHGKRDNGGDGSGPTFSVNLDPCDGYSIHT